MADNQLVILSKAFAVDIISLCENLRERKKATAILNQLLRSGTSIGANIHEANYASSKADFINKFQIALKECYLTYSREPGMLRQSFDCPDNELRLTARELSFGHELTFGHELPCGA